MNAHVTKMMQEAAELGLRVCVQHNRFFERPKLDFYNSLPTMATSGALRQAGLKIKPRGGETVVALVDKDEEILSWGVAKCSKRDNFNRARGLEIALGRALVKLRKARATADYSVVMKMSMHIDGQDVTEWVR